jgi:hypothetical protein
MPRALMPAAATSCNRKDVALHQRRSFRAAALAQSLHAVLAMIRTKSFDRETLRRTAPIGSILATMLAAWGAGCSGRDIGRDTQTAEVRE